MEEKIIKDTKTKRYALIVTTLASFLPPFMGSAVNIALPSISKEFLINAILLGWIPTSYILATVIFLIPLGRIADIFGRKKVFKYGVLIYTISSLLCGLSTSVIPLIIFRIFQGLGSAMTFGSVVAILTSVFPLGERGKALGIYLSSVYLGLSLGPFLGGILTHHFGWRSIFLINVPLGLIVIALGLRLKGEWVGAKGEKFDLIGSIVLSVALIAMMYGFSTLPSLNGVYLIIVGIIGIFLFVGIESKVKNPVFNIKIFKNNRMFTLSSVVSLINYSATFAVAFLLSLYLQYIKGLTPQNAGLIIASQPIIMSISSPFTGRISDKVEPKIVVTIGMIIITLSLFFFTFLNKGTRLSLIIFDFIFFGIGFSLFASPNTNAIMSSVEKRFYGIASATVAIMRMIGQMLSMGIAMLLFAIYMGRVQITPDQFPNFLKSMKIAFIIFTFLCLVDIFISLARGEVKKQE